MVNSSKTQFWWSCFCTHICIDIHLYLRSNGGKRTRIMRTSTDLIYTLTLLVGSCVLHVAAQSSSPAPAAAPPLRSHQSAATHGPFSGTATVSGALMNTALGTEIPAGPPAATATTYPSDGQLHNPQPAPFVPAGGRGTNGTQPVYNVKSDFDYESLVSGCISPPFLGMNCTNDELGPSIVSRMDRTRSLSVRASKVLRARIHCCRPHFRGSISDRVHGRTGNRPCNNAQ